MTHLLGGNGAALIRARGLAAAIQTSLERVYALDRAADIEDHLDVTGTDEREQVELHEADDGAFEIAVRVPQIDQSEFDFGDPSCLDPLCQLIEGVSHFVYLTQRVTQERPTTQLELEVQAEVDKYVILAGHLPKFGAVQSEKLRERLYELVRYGDEEATLHGERYRYANEVAHRYVRRLEGEYIEPQRFLELRAELRSFYRMGQEAKLRSATGR